MRNVEVVADRPFGGTKARLKPGLREGVSEEAVRLDWEHVEWRWLRPEDVGGFETVPGLVEALARVYEAPR